VRFPLTLLRTLVVALALTASITALPSRAAHAGACDADSVRDLPDDTITASWYGKKHRGKRTTSGEVFDEKKMTAAHATLPLNTVVEVTNLVNGKKVQVKINDRGVESSVIDLAEAAAKALGMVRCGLALVVLSAPAVPKLSK
jgi:rare lipoprotein A